MAITLPPPGVQGSELFLGPAMREKSILIVPGTSDYVTGGYVVSALQAGFLSTYGIMMAWVSGQNSTAAGYVPQITLALAQLATSGAGFEGYAQFKFQVFVTGTASGDVLNEASSGVNLSGAIWVVTCRGQ